MMRPLLRIRRIERAGQVNNRSVFEKLKTGRKEAERCLCTVLDGVFAGEKMLTEEGEAIAAPSSLKAAELLKHCAEKEKTGVVREEDCRVFCEKISGRCTLVICGAGHVSISVIMMAKRLGMYTIVIEDRPLFADHARAVGADQVICESFEKGLEQVVGSPDTYFVVVTRGHRHDMDCLRVIAGKQYGYVGMMGSRRRTQMVKQQLMEEGISGSFLQLLHAPIGLDIHAETPDEIAVSVLAEIIQVKNSTERLGGYDDAMLEKITEAGAGKMTLATIISRKGSAPRAVGTHMLILEDGRTVGTIGGGCMESRVIHESLSCMRQCDEFRKVLNVSMTAEAAEEEGMVCGGILEVYIESL